MTSGDQATLDLVVDPLAGCQPRFVAYCRVHGFASRAEQLEQDRKRFPGGVMCGFICWISRAWTVFGHQGPRTPDVHRAFDAWLPTFTETV